MASQHGTCTYKMFSASQNPRLASQLRPWWPVIVAACVPAGYAALIGTNYGPLPAQHFLTSCTRPTSLIWFALVAAVLRSWMSPVPQSLRGLLIFACILLTVTGNREFSKWFIGTLEAPYYGLDPLSGPTYELVAVAGGSVNVLSNDSVQFGSAGDRVGLAARMYHAGKAKRIVVLGGTNRLLGGNARSETDATFELLQQLGVPKSQLLTSGGDNTLGEMQNLAAIVQANPNQRLGVISSAWHLPRVMRLCAAAELQADPLPADFRSRYRRQAVDWWLPNAEYLWDCAFAAKEHLAVVVGR